MAQEMAAKEAAEKKREKEEKKKERERAKAEKERKRKERQAKRDAKAASTGSSSKAAKSKSGGNELTSRKLFQRIKYILKGADTDTLTTKSVRKALEAHFEQSLKDRKKEVNSLIVQALSTKQSRGGKKKTTSKGRKKKASKTSGRKRKRAVDEEEETEPKKKSGFLTVEYDLSDDLARLVGCKRANRPTITKGLWDYAKKNGLKDPEDGRLFILDAAFKKVIGKELEKDTGQQDKVRGFSVQKYIKSHLTRVK